MVIGIARLTTRQILIVVHDLVATAAAIIASFYIRFETAGLLDRLDALLVVLPGYLVYAGLVYWLFHLYRGKWRFASLPDLSNIFRAVTVLALSLLVLDYVLVAPNILGAFFFGKITIVLYWFLQMFFLGGPRIAYRYFRFARTRQHAMETGQASTLVLGRAADAEVLLRAIESNAVKKIWPAGILSPSRADQGQWMRGVAVLGGLDDLERVVGDLAARDRPVARVIFTPSALEPNVKPETILMKARRLGLATSRLPSLDEGGEALRLAPVNVEDLLLRPGVRIDYRRLENFVQGKSIIVTGGGGSIGAEICDRIVTFGAARVLVIENSEPALHAVLEMLATKQSEARIEGRLADVRDRDRMFRLTTEFRPEIVFHAAALKHVPLLERDWDEGVKTNVFGSVNVADAAAAAGAAAMVMISTDKAIKFKAQIDAGGPLTVTHPEMVRYFMTIREACDLVVTAASHALGPDQADVAVYVLNMGQPVKIVELAERMIRLSGLEPGRDIDITFTGIRPGERLQEILFAREEPTAPIGIEGIVAAKPVSPSLEAMRGWLAALEQGLRREDRSVIYGVLRDAVPDFGGEAA